MVSAQKDSKKCAQDVRGPSDVARRLSKSPARHPREATKLLLATWGLKDWLSLAGLSLVAVCDRPACGRQE